MAEKPTFLMSPGSAYHHLINGAFGAHNWNTPKSTLNKHIKQESTHL